MLALALLLMELSRYPILEPGVQAHYLSSYDRSGGNDDGFDGTYSALHVDAKGEQVIVDVKGPGTLYNLWFTSPSPVSGINRGRTLTIAGERRTFFFRSRSSTERHGWRSRSGWSNRGGMNSATSYGA
jgi:hypothetical protein